jgi:hypothetical protein
MGWRGILGHDVPAIGVDRMLNALHRDSCTDRAAEVTGEEAGFGNPSIQVAVRAGGQA